MRNLTLILVCFAALLTGCQTTSRLDQADLGLLVVNAELTLDAAEASYDAWSRVAERSGMLPLEVASRRAQWETRIALIRAHLDWLRGLEDVASANK